MTDIEARLRSELPTLADGLLLYDQQLFKEDEAASKRRGLRLGAVVLVASLMVAAAAGVVLRQQSNGRRDLVQTTSQADRVVNLESKVLQQTSSAMDPTIPPGSSVLMFELAENVVLQRGDLVVVRSRSNPDVDLIRRIVGLPGEGGGSSPPLRIDGEWIAQPHGANGDRSPVTGESGTDVRSSRINFGYVLTADNQLWEDDTMFNRFSHDELRLWAPADTTAVPPLAESERAQQVVHLEACLNAAGLTTSTIRMDSRAVFSDVSRELNAQDSNDSVAAAVAECVETHALLSR